MQSMLNRQRTILEILSRFDAGVGRTVFVKLCFLLRHESPLKDDPTFYDFVPYRYGPFSFVLYHELESLAKRGLISESEHSIALAPSAEVDDERSRLPRRNRAAVDRVLADHGGTGRDELLRGIYQRYPFYASRSELNHEILGAAALEGMDAAELAIYTVGYAGLSLDSFMAGLVQAGIKRILDVRHNPVSRKFGFSRSRLRDVAARLGIEYTHMPQLGIPGRLRKGLGVTLSHTALFSTYDAGLLGLSDYIEAAAKLVRGSPTALLCAEADPSECHRSRLALALERVTGLETVHLGRCCRGTLASPNHSQDLSDPIQSAR